MEERGDDLTYEPFVHFGCNKLNVVRTLKGAPLVDSLPEDDYENKESKVQQSETNSSSRWFGKKRG